MEESYELGPWETEVAPTSGLLCRQGADPRHTQLLSASAFYLPTRKQGYRVPSGAEQGMV